MFVDNVKETVYYWITRHYLFTKLQLKTAFVQQSLASKEWLVLAKCWGAHAGYTPNILHYFGKLLYFSLLSYWKKMRILKTWNRKNKAFHFTINCSCKPKFKSSSSSLYFCLRCLPTWIIPQYLLILLLKYLKSLLFESKIKYQVPPSTQSLLYFEK